MFRRKTLLAINKILDVSNNNFNGMAPNSRQLKGCTALTGQSALNALLKGTYRRNKGRANTAGHSFSHVGTRT